jgi:hypothetical protein
MISEIGTLRYTSGQREILLISLIMLRSLVRFQLAPLQSPRSFPQLVTCPQSWIQKPTRCQQPQLPHRKTVCGGRSSESVRPESPRALGSADISAPTNRSSGATSQMGARPARPARTCREGKPVKETGRTLSHTSICLPHLYLSATPLSVCHTFICLPHLYLSATPLSVCHTFICLPHLYLSATL